MLLGVFFGSWVPVLSQQQIFKQLFILTKSPWALQKTVDTHQPWWVAKIKTTEWIFLCANAAVLLLMPLNVLCIFPLKGKRTLGLLVENCGRVNYGKTLDEQRKGASSLTNRWLCRHSSQTSLALKSFPFIWDPLEKLIKIHKETEAALTHLSGLVGDILLNEHTLRDFNIHSLDMKPAFLNRFVCVSYYSVSPPTFVFPRL